MMSEAEKAIIAGLQAETQYVVRVTCDCGEAGRSKESISVNVCTTKLKPLTESLKITSFEGREETRRSQNSCETSSVLDTVSEKLTLLCFVAQAALARLTPTQKYVFDSVLSIFGKDVAENIRVLVTFADGRRPPVLEAINAAGVPCPKSKDGLPVHFKFNNSALFADNRSSAAGSKSEDDDDDEGFDQMFWEHGDKKYEEVLQCFH
ncbi:hypothetical protein GBF38_000721 [Nibea albiflora]|nr:hypothetical protein GBF38_000721 [Nibea albiflora]